MRTSMVLATLVAGCSGETSTPDVPDPVPYLPEHTVQAPETQLDSAAVASTIEAQLRTFSVSAPLGLSDALDAMMAHADGGCPYVDTFDDGAFSQTRWYDDCESSDGTRFVGGFELSRYTSVAHGKNAEVTGLTFFATDLRIETADGQYLEAAGYFSLDRIVGDGYDVASFYGGGSLRADPTTAGDDPWLSGQREGSAQIYLADWGGYRAAYLGGAVSIDDGGPVVGIALQDVAIELGWCSNEPFGSVSVREASGAWHDVLFAYYDESAKELMDCDGCGLHVAAGEPLGDSVCLSQASLDAVVDWDGGLPW
ncbi:MAG: hypothetical protein KTR31_25165 [Myxococcales bacterium]|nr:hypothetical protein [Myxococcales bacterium]